ncbi:MAG TPA: tetratricopeptide repeat protein [Amycolatopsis sp.]|nr:tetratricopeptide repeat protein [Amycolatopsis sp.]
MAPDPGYRRADALVDLGRHDDARAELASVLAREPQWTAAWCLLSYTERMAGDNAAALEAADRAIGTDPASPTAHRLRAASLDGLGRRAEAVSSAREAVRLGPLDWSTHLVLANILVRLIERPIFRGRRRTIAEARAAAGRAVELAPEEPAPHVTRGMLAGARGRHRQAAAGYREALRLDPNYLPAVYHLAASQARRGSVVRAATGYAAVLGSDPSFEAARRGIDALFEQIVRKGQLLVLGCLALTRAMFVTDVTRVAAGVLTVLVWWPVWRIGARLPEHLRRRASRDVPLVCSAVALAAAPVSAWVPEQAGEVVWAAAFLVWGIGLGVASTRRSVWFKILRGKR